MSTDRVPVRIPLSAPDIEETDVAAVVEVLRSGRLSLGPQVPAFERAVADYVGSHHGLAVNSGTTGLHLTLEALGLGPGDEVITSPFSFIASANAILLAGATPVFVDIDPETLNIDPDRIEQAITPRTRALLVVHVFGRPAPMEPILEIARRRSLLVVEDACEALGAEIGGRKAGSLGVAGVFAFYPNKQITTGEGGLVVTDDGDLARRLDSLRNQGRAPDDSYRFERLGHSVRLTDLQAALGVAQMRRIEPMLRQRERVARAYDARLAAREDLLLPALSIPDGRVSWFVYVVRLRRCDAAGRDRVARELSARGIGCGRYFPAIHLQPLYRRRLGSTEGDFPHAESAAEQTLALPFSNRLDEARIDEVCAALAAALEGQPGRA